MEFDWDDYLAETKGEMLVEWWVGATASCLVVLTEKHLVGWWVEE